MMKNAGDTKINEGTIGKEEGPKIQKKKKILKVIRGRGGRRRERGQYCPKHVYLYVYICIYTYIHPIHIYL